MNAISRKSLRALPRNLQVPTLHMHARWGRGWIFVKQGCIAGPLKGHWLPPAIVPEKATKLLHDDWQVIVLAPYSPKPQIVENTLLTIIEIHLN